MAGRRTPLSILRDEPDEPAGDVSRETSAVPPLSDPPLAADPKPKRAGRATSKPTAATVKAISAELHVGIKFVAAAWSIRDEHCGPVLNQHSQAIAGELAEILAKDARVASWFEGVSGFGTWIKLLMVVQPVVEAIMDHHVFRTVSRETPLDEEGATDGAWSDTLPPFHPGQRYAS